MAQKFEWVMEDSPLSLSKAVEPTSSGSLLSSASSAAQQWINPPCVNTKRKQRHQQFVLHDPKLCMAHFSRFEDKTSRVFFKLHLRGSHPPISLQGSRLYHMLQVLRRIWLFVLLAHSTITSSGRNCRSSGIHSLPDSGGFVSLSVIEQIRYLFSVEVMVKSYQA